MSISLVLWQLEKPGPYKHCSCEIQQSLGGGLASKLGLKLQKAPFPENCYYLILTGTFLEKPHSQRLFYLTWFRTCSVKTGLSLLHLLGGKKISGNYLKSQLPKIVTPIGANKKTKKLLRKTCGIKCPQEVLKCSNLLLGIEKTIYMYRAVCVPRKYLRRP